MKKYNFRNGGIYLVDLKGFISPEFDSYSYEKWQVVGK